MLISQCNIVTLCKQKVSQLQPLRHQGNLFVTKVVAGFGAEQFENTLVYISSPCKGMYNSHSCCICHTLYEENSTHYCRSTPVHQYASTPAHQYTSTLVHQYTSTPVHQFTSTPAHQFTSTPVHQFTLGQEVRIINSAVNDVHRLVLHLPVVPAYFY